METINKNELRFWNPPWNSYQQIFMIISFSQLLHDNLKINFAIMETILTKIPILKI